MLIADFAHQLFNDVFNGDDAGGTAKFINHHGKVHLGLLEVTQLFAQWL